MKNTTDTLRRAAAWLAAAAFLLPALVVMLRAPKVPYADQWRFQAHLLSTPFPQSVVNADNGHHELLPSLVRLAELHWLHGGQWLQIGIGIVLLLATQALGWRQLAGLPSSQRNAAALALLLGLCWLGNQRALGHGNETVHAYSVTALLLAGLLVLGRKLRPDAGAAGIAALCGFAAAFSFGSGIAAFAAFFPMLWLTRARLAAWAALSVGLVLTLAALQLTGDSTGALAFAPLSWVSSWLRWLAGPWIHAVWPALDPALAARLPSAAGALLSPVASAYDARFGPVMLAWFPHIPIALAGLAALAWQVLKAWQAPQTPWAPAQRLGIGIALFAAATGALVAVVRDAYFQTYPDQLLAPRYLVWSSLFWAGLLLAAVARASSPRRALSLVLVVALVLLPSQVWTAKLAGSMRQVAVHTAVAAAVGVVDRAAPLGENVPAEIVAALPLQRQAQVEMFAWPQARWLGRRPSTEPLAVRGMQAETVDNLLETPARRVRFATDAAGGDARLLLVDAEGVARGLAVPDPAAGPGHWIGWMEGNDTTPPRAMRMPE
ncbi:hypothetical protein CQ393_05395 [Stenotrophomonas sp. MYb238]|uniref:hypothetical protein n=1 Tax=Stenotrophomonas sp. MYb238 TaxID=2040281 RepID=UPI00129268C1|nr:hypothetical protein [Stenotrophomonas sp. MYb238]MQP75330.1 hypothetical protein [Stenotrophomonas sp. MYb238]